MNQVEIYFSNDNQTQVEVKFEEDTVWLTQKQMASLFDKNLMTINEHIKNIYEEGELDDGSTIRKSLIVQTEGKRTIKRKTLYYNLDVIISIGYRVKSKRGTQFRQWATQRLRDLLLMGYTINQKRLEELGKMVQLIEQSGKTESLQLQEAKGLIEVLGNYTKSFVLLNQYDTQNVKTPS